MQITSIFLSDKQNIDFINNKLNIKLKKNIERTFIYSEEDKHIFFTKFNVISFFNYSEDKIIEFLKKLDIKNYQNYKEILPFQDYKIIIDNSIKTFFDITNERIAVKTLDINIISIISLVISQSVALEHYEKKLELEFAKNQEIMRNFKAYSINRRTKLMKFAVSLNLLRNSVISDIYLLDKPDMLWENEIAENIYNKTYKFLELPERYKLVEYKLTIIKDDITNLIDIVSHKHAEYLEWIIIILIFIEIVMGVYEMFIK